MHSPLKSRRTGRAQPVQLTAVATLCAALWCGSSIAAPPAGAAVQPTPTAPATNAGAQANAGLSSSDGASLRRVALGGVAAIGLWSIWRSHQVNQAIQNNPVQNSPAQSSQPAQASTPAGAQAGLPLHTGDNDDDKPIDMDGINGVDDLDHYSIRRLMDTLRLLRASKAFDCAHGRSAIDYFCAKIALVIEALDRHGVRDYGDQSHDGCHCR